MAKTTGSATLPVATSVTPASSVFGDLFGTIDSAFDRYMKFDQYQLGKKQVSALQQQSAALTQLAEAQYAQATTPATSNEQLMQFALIGAIAIGAAYLLAKA